MTLETADLLAIAGIVLALLLAVVGGPLAWLKSDIRDLRTETRTEIRAVNARVDVLTQAIFASALARGPLVDTPETGTSPSATESQPTPTG